MQDKYLELSFYERIMTLRTLFAKREIKGTGEGRTSKGNGDIDSFEFIQLPDFLPEAQLRCNDLGLFPVVTIEGNVSTLTVYDVKSDKTIVFTAPTCPIRVNNPGQSLQAIGAQISYSRRYLWLMFLDLCTHDELDEGLYDQGLPQVTKKEVVEAPVQEQPPVQQRPMQNPRPAQNPRPRQNTEPPAQTTPNRVDFISQALYRADTASREEILQILSQIGISIQNIEAHDQMPINSIGTETLRSNLKATLKRFLQERN